MALRKEFSKELENMHNEMIRLGSMVEKAINGSRDALLGYDKELADQVIEQDDLIDEATININKICVMLIARQQPVASDLRDITSNLKLSADLERMADHAEDICVQVRQMIARNQRLRIPKDIERMFDEARKMTAIALDSYVSRDREKALDVMKRDDTVDNLYSYVYTDLLNQMRNDTKNIDGYINLLMVAKHIERCADHAENVAEWVMYYLEGAFDYFEDHNSEDKAADSEEQN